MKKVYVSKGIIFLILLLAIIFVATAYAAKVTVCHIPPGDPENYHDITISETALQAHLDHGDYEGTCQENCPSVCDDDNACTIDYDSSSEECICLDEPRPAVDCDDSNPCTADACNSAVGCTYDAAIMNGESCDDGDPATQNDVCTDGVCAGTSLPSCTDANPFYLCVGEGECDIYYYGIEVPGYYCPYYNEPVCCNTNP